MFCMTSNLVFAFSIRFGSWKSVERGRGAKGMPKNLLGSTQAGDLATNVVDLDLFASAKQSSALFP